MGHNKALMPFRGQPLIQRVVERVSPLATKIFIIANEPDAYLFLNLPIFEDKVKGGGVLIGLFTALSVAPSPYVAVLACDLPFVNNKLITAELNLIQAESVDVVIPESKNGLEPLHAIYRRDTCLLQVQKALATDQKRLVSWLGHVRVRVMHPAEVAEVDPSRTAFININTPEELSRAEALEK
jgi:molybdopterin-guanine dinucleotide biosynthesis protein A